MGVISYHSGYDKTARAVGSPTRSAPMAREVGRVKYYNVAKGYGFIRRPGKSDVFFHHSALPGPGSKKHPKEIKPGQKVEFIVFLAQKGPQAEDMILLG